MNSPQVVMIPRKIPSTWPTFLNSSYNLLNQQMSNMHMLHIQPILHFLLHDCQSSKIIPDIIQFSIHLSKLYVRLKVGLVSLWLISKRDCFVHHWIATVCLICPSSDRVVFTAQTGVYHAGQEQKHTQYYLFFCQKKRCKCFDWKYCRLSVEILCLLLYINKF